MKSYARIENGIVVEIFSTDGNMTEMFHPSLIWEDINGTAPEVGWRFADGMFFAPPPRPFSPIAAEYLNSVRVVREKILNRLPGIGFSALLAGDTALVQAVDNARKALLDIPAAPAVLAATDAAGIKAAVLDAYRAIVATAPAMLVRAFDAEGL